MRIKLRQLTVKWHAEHKAATQDQGATTLATFHQKISRMKDIFKFDLK